MPQTQILSCCLTIGLPKCEFVVKEIDFLGNCVSVSGCWPLVKHSAAISAFPQPTDKPGLQRFLWMIIFYRKFLWCSPSPCSPHRCSQGSWEDHSLDSTHDSAFIRAKQLLSFVLELVHPQCNAPISLAVDASDSHTGAIQQQQLLDKSWSLLAFFSKKLSNTEKKYSAFNRELLAA